MATNPKLKLQNVCIDTFTITSGVTLAVGDRVKFGASDELVAKAGNGEDAFGTVAIGGTGTADGKVKAQIYLDGHAIVPMRVGTGGVSRGSRVRLVADGITNTPTAGGGTVAHATHGRAMQEGVVGDVVGVLVGGNGVIVAAT